MSTETKLVENVSSAKGAVESAERALSQAESKSGSIYKDKEKATKKLEAQLAKVRKPFDDRIRIIDSRHEKIQDSIYQKQDLVLDAEGKLKLYQSTRDNAMTAEGFEGWFRLNNFTSYNISRFDSVSVKKTLSNGLVVIRLFDDYNSLAYYVFHGTRFVGYWAKRQSLHAGDSTYADAWIGQATPTRDNETRSLMDKKYPSPNKLHPYQVNMKHPFQNDGRISLTAFNFFNYVESLDESKLPKISLTKAVKETLADAGTN